MNGDVDLLNTAEAAVLLGVAEITLRKRRCATYKGPAGPPYLRTKFGRIVYSRRALMAWNELTNPPPRPVRPRPVSPAPRP